MYKVIDPETVTIAASAQIGEGVVIFPNNHILGQTRIGAGAVLYPNNILEDAAIGAGAQITASVVRGAQVGDRAEVGPFALLRPGACVEAGCRIGDFVEIKNARIGAGSKVSHLAYVGDADVGKRCNIGCGVIFCNYDGTRKAHSVVEDECFVGSNVNLVAPVKVGKGSYIAAGTTVTEDVPPGSFIIGRVRQQSHARLAEKYARGGTGGQGRG